MALPTEARRRAGIRTALLLQPQSGAAADGYRSPATDLSSATHLWPSIVRNDNGIIKSEDHWMSVDELPAEDDRINLVEFPDGTFTSIVTPDTISAILKSTWGPLAAGAFALQGAIDKYVTLGWVEDRTFKFGGELLRYSDVWVHRCRLRIDPND